MPYSLRRALPLALLIAALAPASGHATVTRSSVTSPANPTYRLYEPTKKAEERLAVAGMTDGALKDLVDIVCTDGVSITLVAQGVAVGADGRFAADVSLKLFRNRGCILRAVPAGYRGKELQPFGGPMVAVTYFDPNDFTVPVRGGGVATLDYYVATGHRRARAELRSAGNFGLKAQIGVHPEELGSFPRETWDQGASLWTGPREGVSAIEVDGRVAYLAGNVPRFEFEGDELPSAPAGQDGVRATLTLDQVTGRVRVEESQRVLRCDRWDRTMPLAEDCESVLDTGVRLERTVSFDAEHAIADFTDRWISTDGTPHRLRLIYTHDADDSDRPLWRFPGEPRFTYRKDQDTMDPKAPGTVFVRGPEDGMAVGALTFTPAPQQFAFDGYDRPLELTELTVPAGGVAPVRRTFALAENLIAAEALARGTADGLAAPAVSIAGPADGSVTGQTSVTVTGRATDNVAVASLTVNGRTVAVGADGSFSAPVTLGTGPNRITVVATDGAGLTGSASIDLTRSAPRPLPVVESRPQAGVVRCSVPRVKAGATVKVARAALKRAGCRTARSLRRKRSAKVAKGRVISLSRRAGDSAPITQPIAITVSSGRKRR